MNEAIRKELKEFIRNYVDIKLNTTKYKILFLKIVACIFIGVFYLICTALFFLPVVYLFSIIGMFLLILKVMENG